MSVRMTERDLEALRRGITAQVERETRRQLYMAELDQERQKRHIRHAKVIQASELKIGDVICSTSGYRFFKEEMVVKDIQTARGSLWIVSRYGGNALLYDDPVLVEVTAWA